MAREYARQIGREGVNYPWFFNIFGRDLFFTDAVSAKAAGIQKGNIASMASQCYDTYRYFGDAEDLRKRLPLMKEMLDFLVAEILVQDGDCWGTCSLIGTDENIQRVNDCGHLMKLIRALRDYQDGCKALGLSSDPLYACAIDGLSDTMCGNYRDGVLYPWKGAKDALSNVSLLCREYARRHQRQEPPRDAIRPIGDRGDLSPATRGETRGWSGRGRKPRPQWPSAQ